MPRRETRHDIERALSEQRNNRRSVRERIERMQARMEQDLARLRDTLDPSEFDRVRDELEKAFHKFRIGLNRQRRGPEDGGLPALVKPPRGPKPLAGGAAPPLEFD